MPSFVFERTHRKVLCASAVLGLFIGLNVFAQQTRGAAGSQQLYLLAGTPASERYPVTLYSVQGGKLRVVREVIPQAEGVQSVQPGGNVIFLVHPALNPEAVAIIHTEAPLRVDDVPINPDGGQLFINPYELLLAEPHEPILDELLASNTGEVTLGNVHLLVISSDLAASPRVTTDNWIEYASLRFEGAPGGPDENANPQIVFLEVSGDSLVLHNSFANQVVKIDSLAPVVRDAANATTRHRLIVVAADGRYLLLKNQYSFEELGKAGRSHLVFVHDRSTNQWGTVQVEGTSNLSRSRFFAPWLTTMVVDFDPNKTAGPGRENERGPEAFGPYQIAGQKGNPGNAHFPIIRGQIGGASGFVPGVLLLNNIADGRMIRIETNQEDSEILHIRDDLVFYRVNDTIYQARIVGSRLQETSVVVKDEDVPEVHWVFWIK